MMHVPANCPLGLARPAYRDKSITEYVAISGTVNSVAPFFTIGSATVAPGFPDAKSFCDEYSPITRTRNPRTGRLL
jgi:hypothetical protein